MAHSFIMLAQQGPLAGKFVIDGESEWPLVNLGAEVRITYKGVRACAVDRGESRFSLILEHTLVHGGDRTAVTYRTASRTVAEFLISRLRKGVPQRLQVVEYCYRGHVWYWPGVDGVKL